MRKPKKESKPRLAGQKSSLRSLGNNVVKIEERVKVAKGVTPIISPWKCGPGVEKLSEKRGDLKMIMMINGLWKACDSVLHQTEAALLQNHRVLQGNLSITVGNATHPSQRNPTYAQLQVHGWKAVKRPFSRQSTALLEEFLLKVHFLRMGYVNFGGR